MVTVEAVRELALSLPRSTERLVRDRVKFGVGRLIYVAFSRDERTMGFAYPKEQRAALVAAEPEKFRLPRVSEQRYNWVDAWLHALDPPEMHELVVDAWCMCVPAKVRAAYFATVSPDGGP
ncbi:MAG: MmcQ/YjbR family DNA-binding protein [Pseudonocardia sp.]|nr:MmcQ/YjbR family DNA-binding protein [Pseudonocardia sp.]